MTKRNDSHFSGFDDLNDFKDKIIANLGTNANAWKTETDSNTAMSVVGRRRKRQASSVVEGLVQLAGFALSIFNRQELNSIQKSIEDTQTENNYVASKVDDAFLRMDQLIDHTNKVYKVMLNIAQTNRNLHTKQKKATIVAEVDRLSRIFVSETTMFLTGLQALLDNKFSLLLVDPEQLQSVYDEIVDRADDQPITDDADLIFQAEVSVLGTQDDDLLGIIHIPLYSGELMNFFRYVPAPFILQDGLTTTIRSEKSYLALDSSGTLGKELSEAESFRCKHINRIYHCGNENVLQKNLS